MGALLSLLTNSALTTALFVSSPLASAPTSAKPRGADRLAELIADSRAITGFSARYTISFELNPGVEAVRPADGTIRIVLSGADGVRVERSAGDDALLMWCNATTIAMRMRSTAGERFGRLDVGEFNAEARRLRARLDESFPKDTREALRDAHEGSVALFSWSYDGVARKANWEVMVATGGTVASPLGWLETLRNKNAQLIADGDLLRFETDSGHFRGALRARDGVLESLVGESPNGRMTIALAEMSREPADPELFEVPVLAPPGARDISSELRRSVLGTLHAGLRTSCYRGAARCASFERECAKGASAWLASFHEFAIRSTLDPWFELLEKRRTTLVERLKAFAASGRTQSQVQEQRQRELALLARGIDEMEKSFDGLLELSGALAGQQNAQELSALERRSLAATFDQFVRRKVMAEFESATKLD